MLESLLKEKNEDWGSQQLKKPGQGPCLGAELSWIFLEGNQKTCAMLSDVERKKLLSTNQVLHLYQPIPSSKHTHGVWFV